MARVRPNINDKSKLPDLKRELSDRDVSAAAIVTIEKALKKGMEFKGLEDLAILNIPTADLNIVSDVVGFGPPPKVVKNIKTVEYQFRPIGDEDFFFGYQLLVTFLNKAGFTIEQSYPIEGSTPVIVDYDLNDLLKDSVVTLRVNTAQGQHARIRPQANTNTAPTAEIIELTIPALKNQAIDVAVEEMELPDNPSVAATYPVKGKVISNRPGTKMDGYQVVIFAATADLADEAIPDFIPVAFATTETNGYFITGPLLFDPADGIGRVIAAKAAVSHEELAVEIPVRLVVTEAADDETPGSSMVPDRLILMIEEAAGAEAPDVAEDGCAELNFHEKKVVEEYSYYTVVRTSEPSIIADVLEDEREIDLQDIYGVPGLVPFNVFKKFHAIQSKRIGSKAAENAAAAVGNLPTMMAASLAPPAAGTAPAAAAAKTAAFDYDLLNRLTVEHRANVVIKGDAKPVFKGRMQLSQANQIDWDDEPTIYQAASIAHGHLLHFKQEWVPDGYSIGDIVYSLPLAPGQKKQIAVLDWERRESAANSQSLDYEESLNNSLVRDRDINEVISGTLTENIRGTSKATTSGFGFGLGSAVMGIFTGGSYGALLGISGGKSSAGSTASQSSNRQSTANSLQQITDRTMQAASVVRSQRATVVQTVSQGERVQATAESVANYNHCHAITIQYFEVLRHLTVRNRLAGVQECLFVPLQIGPFDLEKCLRWRNALENCLFRRELLPAFDAVARIQNEKESAFENYYDSIGFPRKNFAEHAVVSYTGELFMDFFFFNTKEEKIDDAIKAFYVFFGISLDEFRDRKITDAELAEHVGPRAIEYLLDAFTVETDKGVDLKLDLTLLSTFRQNATLRISMRQGAATPVNVARDQIAAINVKLDLAKLAPEAADNLRQFQNKYMKIRLRSGHLRYRTEHMAGTLIDGRIDNDIFAGSDGAYTPTPLTRDELRNPRGEDVSAANNLIHHLNENLEYYHKCLFFDMTPERRFMLLDGLIAPGKAQGRSVASVVENRVIGIAGNSLIMPVAPGYQLDPTIDDSFDLFAQYFHDEPDPMRISMPTKGIYAEAVMGKCNSCEEKDESRFWRWEESPIPDSPNTQILPLDTGTRRADPGDLQPKDFPNPVVNIQNAPNLPDPAGLQSLLALLGKGDAFRDLTGLNQNQLNALAAFQKTLDTAQSFGKEAASLAKAAGIIDLIKNAKQSGTVSNEQAKDKAGKAIDSATPETPEEKTKRITQQLETLNKAFESGNISGEQLQSLSESVLKDLSAGEASGLQEGAVSSLIGTAKANNANVSFKTNEGEQLDIDTQPSRLKRLTRDGVVEVEETTGFVSGDDVFLNQQPAPGAEIKTIHVRNRFRPEIVPNCTVSVEAQGISGVTNALGRVRLDFAALADGDYTLTVTPAAVHAAATYSGLGDPAAAPPDRIWEAYSGTITIAGNLVTSADPNIGIVRNDINVRLRPAWMRSPNQNARPAGTVPDMIIIHHTGNISSPSGIDGPIREWMRDTGRDRTSTHYVIGRDGWVVKLVHESVEAWQAGCSHWGGRDNVNNFSISIEIVHTNSDAAGTPGQYVEDFTPEQYVSLEALLADLTSAFQIPPHRVVGHADIGTNDLPSGACVMNATRKLGRKSSDPGKMFDWATVEAQGFGLTASGGMMAPDTEYGGFFDQFPASSLRPGDRDTTNKYGGLVRPALAGAGIIAELQADLRRVGYFCPNTGVYDAVTARTALMFNEHFFSGTRQVAGKRVEHVDLDTANMVKGVIRTLESI